MNLSINVLRLSLSKDNDLLRKPATIPQKGSFRFSESCNY